MSLKTTSLSGDANVLTNAPGAPRPEEINKVNETALSAERGNNYTVVEGYQQGTNEFPYRPFVLDTYDSIAQLKEKISGGNYKVPFEKEDAEYLLRQRAQVENADYDRWVMQKYDLSNPAQNLMLQRIDPDQFKRRMDLLKQQLEVESKYAEVRMMGPKSEDDLKFEWLVETGRLQLPEGPLWNPQEWMERQLREYHHKGSFSGLAGKRAEQLSIANRDRTKQALFRPLTHPLDNEVGRIPSNLSDLRGSARYTVNQVFTGSNQANNPYMRYGQNPIIDTANANLRVATPGLAFGAKDRTAYNAQLVANKKGYGFTRV